jgi:hypothetical protein
LIGEWWKGRRGEYRRQKTEDRGQRTDGRGQMAEDGRLIKKKLKR